MESDIKCGRCGELIAYCGDWPSCRCDSEPGLSLTVSEAARYICVSRSKVYDLIATGEIVASWASGRARIAMQSIKAAWAADHQAWRLHEDFYRFR